MTLRHATALAVALWTAIATAAPIAESQRQPVSIRTTQLGDGLYMLEGQGGNIGLCVGEDGAFLIDDQFAPLTDSIRAAVARLSRHPVRFLINTHWHPDHTGGNENFGKAGALIFAHENVRERMRVDQFSKILNRTTPAAPLAALPVVTFSKGVTFHWNGEEIRVLHLEHAHTDGDAIIHFKRANVFHLGDVFFNGSYPLIDTGTGGSMDGMIAAVDSVLKLVDGQSRLIPGHGPIAGMAELREYRTMLSTVRDRIQSLMDRGKTREQVIAARPTSDLDAKWGGGYFKSKMWVGIVYDAMKEPKRTR